MTTVDEDPDKLHADAQKAVEKLLIARYENDIVIDCQVSGCTDAAEWAGVCLHCRASSMLCPPHYNTVCVAAAKFGIPACCMGCNVAGPMADMFVFQLLRSPQ